MPALTGATVAHHPPPIHRCWPEPSGRMLTSRKTKETAMPARIVQPQQMLIGAGASQRLASVLQQMGWQRPFIVTDAFMLESGNVRRLTQPLTDAGLAWAVFADT